MNQTDIIKSLEMRFFSFTVQYYYSFSYFNPNDDEREIITKFTYLNKPQNAKIFTYNKMLTTIVIVIIILMFHGIQWTNTIVQDTGLWGMRLAKSEVE